MNTSNIWCLFERRNTHQFRPVQMNAVFDVYECMSEWWFIPQRFCFLFLMQLSNKLNSFFNMRWFQLQIMAIFYIQAVHIFYQYCQFSLTDLSFWSEIQMCGVRTKRYKRTRKYLCIDVMSVSVYICARLNLPTVTIKMATVFNTIFVGIQNDKICYLIKIISTGWFWHFNNTKVFSLNTQIQ